MKLNHCTSENRLGEARTFARLGSLLLVANLAGMSLTAMADTPPAPGTPIPATEGFEKRVVATGLANPHNMVLGPDGYLWLTEQVSRKITRVNPKTGEVKVALAVADAVHSQAANGHHEQDGLLGIALHPQLLKGTGQDYVYVSLTYAGGDSEAFPNRTLIRRYTYDAKTNTLGEATDLLKGLPSARDHQSARLLFGPDDKLYYSIGDQGANQLSYLCEQNKAQMTPTAADVSKSDWVHYAGKILRLNLDGSVPDDNPVINGVKSHVYAYGIRNVQGMVFVGDKLFATEQGPNSDDELNLIVKGGNYGWPYVAGFKDGQGYAYANYSAAKGGCKGNEDQYQNGLKVPEGIPVQQETQWSSTAFVEPLKTLFSVGNDYVYNQPACKENNLFYICWPTIAPSSVTYYPASGNAAKGWGNSLLITSLKRGVVYRIQLDGSKTVPMGDATPVFRSLNRYRDIAVDPSGEVIYVATDIESSLATNDKGSAAAKFENPGAILAFRSTGKSR
ncbi:TPA: glucose/sorbosone family PQQ-dependent dehydrogenase [Pseudomonas putida]